MVGRRIDVTVSKKDIVHLMGVLSDIYTEPTLAVAREYITNAIDSHVEAGQTRPVEVTLPNVWQSNLIIEDFGIGMNADDIDNTYSQYGVSTKRESNDFNGMLGIGSKSAFAYSGSFSVIGIKNGIKTVVSVQRDAMGVPSMDILSETLTDEGNGVKITIPVSNASQMTAAVGRVTSVLPEGKVLVNGRDNSDRKNWTLLGKDIADDDGNVIIQNLWRKPGNVYNSRIIMGNVAYDLTGHSMNLDWVDRHGGSLVAEVAIGEVVFAPSREKLMDVPKTRATEEFIIQQYNTVLAKALYEKVVNAPSRMEALKQYNAVSGVLSIAGYKNIKYKGEEIPNMYQPVIAATDGRLVGWSLGVGYSRTMNAVHSLNLASFVNTGAVITGVPDDTPTSHYRRKIRQYFEGQQVSSVIILPERAKLSNKWLDGLVTVSHDTIKAIKLPRPVRTGGGGGGVSTKGKHFAWNAKVARYDLREIDYKEKVYYFIKSKVADWNMGKFGVSRDTADERFNNLSEVIAGVLPEDSTLVHVYANRLSKFKDDYPNAKALTQEDAHGMLVDSVIADISDADIMAYQVNRLTNLDTSVFRFIPDDDKDSPTVLADGSQRKIVYALKVIPHGHDFFKKVDEAGDEVKAIEARLVNRYPLLALSNFFHRMSDDAIKRYFEADYNNSKEEE